MSKLEIFRFESKEVRTELVNGEPMFCLKDVCDILDLTNPSMVLERLDKDGLSQIEVIDSLNRKQKASFVDESNLYMVVFQSSKPEAKTFQKWITKEVIPQIRKTGSYAIDNKLPANFAEALKLAYEQQLEIENKNTQLELQKPAVEYYEAVTDSRDALPVGAVAKLLFDNYQITMGRNELFEFLREKKVLMDDNKPYQKYVDIGYFRVVQQKYDVNGETKINIKTLVFQKGIEFILKLIKQKLS